MTNDSVIADGDFAAADGSRELYYENFAGRRDFAQDHGGGNGGEVHINGGYSASTGLGGEIIIQAGRGGYGYVQRTRSDIVPKGIDTPVSVLTPGYEYNSSFRAGVLICDSLIKNLFVLEQECKVEIIHFLCVTENPYFKEIQFTAVGEKLSLLDFQIAWKDCLSKKEMI